MEYALVMSFSSGRELVRTKRVVARTRRMAAKTKHDAFAFARRVGAQRAGATADAEPAEPDKLDFVGTYAAHTDRLISEESNKSEAVERAIGSASHDDFEVIGAMQRDLLVAYGLQQASSVVEVGCGSGRLAVQLVDWLQGPYLGTDVVPTLLDHAASIASAPNMRYEKVTGLSIPAPTASADIVCAFSVFTHLLHEESFAYMQDCVRVLRPGGVLVFSFLEYRVPSHWDVMAGNLRAVGRHEVLNQFLSLDAVEVWAQHLQCEVVDIFRGDEPYIPLTEPLRLGGFDYVEFGTFGQSAAIYRKPVGE